MPIILLAVIILLALMVAASCVRIVPQAHAMIIERLGMYKKPGPPVFILNCHFLTGLQRE